MIGGVGFPSYGREATWTGNVATAGTLIGALSNVDEPRRLYKPLSPVSSRTFAFTLPQARPLRMVALIHHGYPELTATAHALLYSDLGRTVLVADSGLQGLWPAGKNLQRTSTVAGLTAASIGANGYTLAGRPTGWLWANTQRPEAPVVLTAYGEEYGMPFIEYAVQGVVGSSSVNYQLYTEGAAGVPVSAGQKVWGGAWVRILKSTGLGSMGLVLSQRLGTANGSSSTTDFVSHLSSQGMIRLTSTGNMTDAGVTGVSPRLHFTIGAGNTADVRFRIYGVSLEFAPTLGPWSPSQDVAMSSASGQVSGPIPGAPATLPIIFPAEAMVRSGTIAVAGLDEVATGITAPLGAIDLAGWLDFPDIGVEEERGIAPTALVDDFGVGVQAVTRQWAPRTAKGARASMDVTMLDAVADFQRGTGRSRPFVWVRDKQDASRWGREAFLARNRSLPPPTWGEGDAAGFSYDFVEHL